MLTVPVLAATQHDALFRPQGRSVGAGLSYMGFGFFSCWSSLSCGRVCVVVVLNRKVEPGVMVHKDQRGVVPTAS